ncbi:hypothetical protein P175DRAFT_0440603, partial [Aspergillus ochraceoroseus IBT 24754]
HGIYPKEVVTHLQKKHFLKPRDSQPIAQAVAGWAGIIQQPDNLYIPRVLDTLVPIIPIYTNGLLC